MLFLLPIGARSDQPSSPAGAPGPVPEPGATLDEAALLPLNPAIRHGQLANGLTYSVEASPQPEGPVEIWLAVRAGSVLESEAERGLAHFVEHMLFQGTRRFPRQALVDYAESIGMRFGADVNGYTDHDETVYQLRLPVGSPAALERALEVFADWIGGAATFDPAEVDRERRVVLEEQRLRSEADFRAAARAQELLLAGTRYGDRMPGGVPEVIEKVTPAELRAFYLRWYRPELAAVIAVGPFEADHVVGRIQHHLATVPRSAVPAVRPSFELVPAAETRLEVFAHPDLAETQVQVLGGLSRSPVQTIGDFRRSLLAGLHSRLLARRLQSLGQTPDTPWLSVEARQALSASALTWHSQRAVATPGRALTALDALLVETERVRRFGFVPIELFAGKQALLQKLETASTLPTTRSVRARAGDLLAHFLGGRSIPAPALELALAQRFLPGITLEELNRFAQQLPAARGQRVLISGPPSASAPLPTEAEIERLLSEVGSRELERYVERLPSSEEARALLGRPPAGSIVSEQQRPEHGITEWRLSNGALVVLKPIRFGSNEVLVEAFSPGGTSLLPVTDVVAGHRAPHLLRPRELDSSKGVEVDIYINQLDEGVAGKAPTDQIETLLRQLRLAFTSPETDRATISKRLQVEAMGAEKSEMQPVIRMSQAMEQVLFGKDPRRELPKAEQIRSWDPARLLALYRERFANAGDFQFVLVGDFEVETVRPLVESYLASLPANETREAFRDHGVATVRETQTLRSAQGTQPRATVLLLFAGEAPFSPLGAHQLENLRELLERRLLDRLRGQNGQSYTLGVDAWMRARPRGSYQVSIELPGASTGVESLREDALAEIRRLQTEGPTEEEVASLAATARLDRAKGLRRNGFWIDTLINAYRLQDDPQVHLELEGHILTTTPEALRQAARLYLPLDRCLVVILEPEPSTAPAKP